MKKTPRIVFAGLILSLTTLVDAQNRDHPSVSQSPLTLIRLLEEQLGAQFENQARMARETTLQVWQDQELIAHGTVISRGSEREASLVLPADAFSPDLPLMVRRLDGALLMSVSPRQIHVLSREDNLAILCLPSMVPAISTIEGSIPSVGAFVGIRNTGSWKIGAVSNQLRSAYTGVDHRIEKALYRHWDRIGLKVNHKRSGFPAVMETDLAINPEEAGSPVFSRSGSWVGIAISRADQHSTYVIPAGRVIRLMNQSKVAFH